MLTCNHSVGRGNCGDDVLDDTLSKPVSDPWDVVLLGPLQSLFVDPANVIRVVTIELII